MLNPVLVVLNFLAISLKVFRGRTVQYALKSIYTISTIRYGCLTQGNDRHREIRHAGIWASDSSFAPSCFCSGLGYTSTPERKHGVPPIPGKAFDRLVKRQFNAKSGKNIPDQVTISITEDCPNRCTHCALPDTGNRTSLSPDEVK
uniref:Uncharacterized protein n=1 Tax=Candidatus Methanogaster sp. ANME-2c ERB4 TaxID=2759911 RepID=A0A7G9YIR6_9EURY|nr:hypothetical protein LLFONJKP_00021 [Methanosarcinales archaeon ANME-2c ERB4]